MDEQPPGEPEAPPPKDEIKIRDLTGRPRGCASCGRPREPFIEVEVDGVLEYTCRECYEGEVVVLVACRSCGAAIEAGDAFCGKCGTARARACAGCGADLGGDDGFCGKCGAAVT